MEQGGLLELANQACQQVQFLRISMIFAEISPSVRQYDLRGKNFSNSPELFYSFQNAKLCLLLP
jgi:hypothetical protein